MIIPRKSRLFVFTTTPEWVTGREVDRVPGVLVKPDVAADGSIVSHVWCTRDVVEVVSAILEQPIDPAQLLPFDTIDVARDWPGYDRYCSLFLPRARAYQPTASYFIASNAGSMCCDPMRGGKTHEVLGAATIVGAKRTLILTLGTPKLGWGEDVAKWLGDWVLMLDGRAADEAWWFCAHCMGKGLIATDATLRHEWPRCETCRGRGWIKPTSVIEAIESARFLCANYDILIGQKQGDEYGRIRSRLDLPGWAAKIKRYFKPDTVFLDEAHRIGKKGTRRNAVRGLVEFGPDRVVAVTGTPTDGQVANLWWLLDLVSGNMWGRTPKQYCSRYAGAYDGSYGFVIPKRGHSPLADSELPERLSRIMIKRSRAEIGPHLPKLQRHVIRIDATAADEHQLHGETANQHESERMLNATAKIKFPSVVESILDELKEGHKIACYSRNIETGHAISEAVIRALSSRKSANAYASARVRVWDCIGKGYERRVAIAGEFSAHDGAGLFQATIDGFQMGRSLEGLTTNHFPDLHWDPTAIQQCEARGDLWERTFGLVSVFWVLTKSGDEHMISVLIPKLEALESVLGDKDAGSLRDTLSPRETLDEVWARHTAHLRQVE